MGCSSPPMLSNRWSTLGEPLLDLVEAPARRITAL
jgi:hypothetical protein